MNNKRSLQLLLLLQNGETISSGELAQRIGVSDRTVRNELNELRKALEKEGAHLVSSTKTGFFLNIHDEDRFNRYMRSLQKQEGIPTSSEERIQYLLEFLLANADMYVLLDDLSDQLYVSRTTLTKDLKEVRQLLERYNLKLVNRPYYGIKVEGKEFDLRLCLADYTIKRVGYQADKQKEKLEEITNCIEEGLEGSRLQISDVSYQNLIIHIYVVLERLASAETAVIEKSQLADIQQFSEYPYAKRIVSALEKQYHIQIPEDETAYIAIHLASKRIIENDRAENVYIEPEILEIVDKMLKEVETVYSISFRNDLELRMMLATHLIPLSVRLSYDMNLDNPLLKEIKSRYTLAYMMALTAGDVLKKHYHKEITEDEVGYFALHFNLALERRRSQITKKNILVVCSTGRGSAKLLSYRIKDVFNKYLDRIETCDVLNVKNYDLTGIDYIFTTVPINVKLERPIVEIQYFLDENDYSLIRKTLNSSASSIARFFRKELFIENLDALTKEEAIRMMVDQTGGLINDHDAFYESIISREELGSTDFGNLIAIPHAGKIFTKETFVTIAILNRAILWSKEKVQFIFLLALGHEDAGKMEAFSSITSRLLFNHEYIRELIRKPKFENLMKILEMIEEEKNEEKL